MHQLTKQTIADIKNLKIQGATNVVLAIITTLDKLIKEVSFENFLVLKKFILAETWLLVTARPTEPYAQNLYYFLNKNIKNFNQPKDNKKFKSSLKKWLQDYQNYILKNDLKIIRYGVKTLRPYKNILTHCHSSTVVKIIKSLHHTNKKIHVFADETRPLFQGRVTAKELHQAGIKVTQIADSASGFLISSFSGRDLMMEAIVVGADAIKTNGSIINKIGTYDIAASAFLNKIPFYVATSLLKFDFKNQVKIEQRSDRELWPNKPANLNILNFAFDYVPAQFITGLITEVGTVKPKQVKSLVNKHYPWLK